MGRAKVWKLTCLALVAAFALACLAGCAKQPASEPTAAPTQAPAQNGGGDDQPTDQPAAAKDPSEFTGSLMYWCGDQNWSEAMDPAFMEVYPNVNVSFTPPGLGRLPAEVADLHGLRPGDSRHHLRRGGLADARL